MYIYVFVIKYIYHHGTVVLYVHMATTIVLIYIEKKELEKEQKEELLA